MYICKGYIHIYINQVWPARCARGHGASEGSCAAWSSVERNPWVAFLVTVSYWRLGKVRFAQTDQNVFERKKLKCKDT